MFLEYSHFGCKLVLLHASQIGSMTDRLEQSHFAQKIRFKAYNSCWYSVSDVLEF